MRENLLYPELSYRIIGASYAVYNALGPFYREAIYQIALEIELERNQIPFQGKKPVDLTYRGQPIAQYQLDLVVKNQILLELKAVESLHPKHVCQLIQYLAMTGLKLGILINFGKLDGLEYRRVVHERASESPSFAALRRAQR